MIRMYDTLMKSGKFTAIQNKGENGEAIDSIGEIVAICEKDGFIPRYYTDGPKDKVDRVLEDFQHYVRALVTEEMNLGTIIEQAIKELELDKTREAQLNSESAEDEEESLESELFDDDETALMMNESDYAELNQMREEDEEDDEEYLLSLLAEEGES